jgi:hypothetical protein
MKRFPGKLPTPQMIEEMRPYGTPEEFLRSGGFSIEALDRAAFGFCDTDIKRKRAKEIKIRWKDDRENALYQMQRSGKGPKGWARSVDLTTPVEVSYKSLDGKEPQFYIEDGHHRHLAASILDTELNVELSIEISPGHVLYPDMSYDDFHREMYRRMEKMNESVSGISGGEILYHASDQLFKSFDMDKVSGIRGSLYGPGLYFSDNRKYVSMFGKYVYECEVLMRQPFDLTSKNVRGELLKLVSSYEFPSEVQTYVEDTMKSMSYTTLFKELLYIVGVEHLKNMGYDGVIGYCEFGGKEYVIWDDKNVSIKRVFEKGTNTSVKESVVQKNIKLPVKKINKVYHVGTMELEKKAEFSLEGSGLSVSVNPEEWRTIARLGSVPTYVLRKNDGVFVNFKKLGKSVKDEIIQWGVSNGYVETKTTYMYYYFDEELGEEVYMEFPTYEEALEEADEDETQIKINRSGIIPTVRLHRETQQSRIEPIQCFELLLTVYVEGNTDYDGVWWDEQLDILNYSAPRGVLFNTRLDKWTVERVEKKNESGNYLKTRFSEYIRENIENKGKIIYHFTESLDSLLSILQSDSLEAGSSHNMYGLGYDNISFTWNPNLWDIEYFGDVKDRYEAKITFDYDRISKKWDFVPFDYGIEEEQEEIVETDIMEGIIPFIIGIEIRGKYPKSDIDYLKRKFPELKIKKVKK